MPHNYKTRKSTRRMKQRHQNCFYCKCPLHAKNRTIDHKRPIADGGSHLASNLVMACKPCNEEKGDMDFKQFCKSKGVEI